MKKLRTFYQTEKIAGLLLILVIALILSTLPTKWNRTLTNAFIDLEFKIRGPRQLSDDIVFVFIGDQDVDALGWPITRDYYGFLTHIVNSLGAKVIGIDILFDRADKRHEEYDRNLVNFFEAAGNVCLSMKFSSLQETNDEPPFLFNGIQPVVPLENIKQAATGIGFSNLGADAVSRRVPLIVVAGQAYMLSYGAELARLFLNFGKEITIDEGRVIFSEATDNTAIPIDRHGRVRLNHFGNAENLNSISFVDLLQVYESNPDSLNFEGKLVCVAMTDPGRPPLSAPLVSTPLAPLIPAGLIHVTLAENIIHQNYIREVSIVLQLVILFSFGIFVWAVWRWTPKKFSIFSALILLAGYWSGALIFFSKMNLALPLFYPTLVFFAVLIYCNVISSREKQSRIDSVKAMLEQEVIAKENQLAEAKAKLKDMEDQLAQESSLSEQSRHIANERKHSILQLEKEIRDLKAYIIPEKKKRVIQFGDLIYSPKGKMVHVLELVAKVSSDNIPVLILGETGTGKEMIAHAIHETSPRYDKTFVAINCGALSETLLESELFGHERGSFTGAQARRRGRFELANGGTIFLDEITETSPKFQTRLLRVLQEGRFERLGGEQTIKTDVRVIAATNRDLQEEMKLGRFRSDLFYRLNGFPISIPPLRERKEDIPLLATHFLQKHRYETVNSFSDRAMELMQKYHWPGNVRELENVIRRAAILAQSEGRDFIRESDLGDEIRHIDQTAHIETQYQPLEIQILESLRTFQFSHAAISQTAKALGNRDRGTITEHFRGICFEHFVEHNFDLHSAAKSIANSSDEDVIVRVKNKIEEYITNVRNAHLNSDEPEYQNKRSSTFKGLPKKYHSFLQQIIDHFSE